MKKNETSSKEFDKLVEDVESVEKDLMIDIPEDGKELSIEEVKANVSKLANTKCKKCYGRGYLGVNHETQKVILCNGRRCALIKYYFLMHKYNMAKKEEEKKVSEEVVDGQT